MTLSLLAYGTKKTDAPILIGNEWRTDVGKTMSSILDISSKRYLGMCEWVYSASTYRVRTYTTLILRENVKAKDRDLVISSISAVVRTMRMKDMGFYHDIYTDCTD